jgi:hypothetical protein
MQVLGKAAVCRAKESLSEGHRIKFLADNGHGCPNHRIVEWETAIAALFGHISYVKRTGLVIAAMLEAFCGAMLVCTYTPIGGGSASYAGTRMGLANSFSRYSCK